jgi:hypothetical protein
MTPYLVTALVIAGACWLIVRVTTYHPIVALDPPDED